MEVSDEEEERERGGLRRAVLEPVVVSCQRGHPGVVMGLLLDTH